MEGRDRLGFPPRLSCEGSWPRTGPFCVPPHQVTCALCEMLSGPLCQEAVQELYPRLLVAVLCHLYWVIEQNVPQKMVVYSKEEIPGSKSKTFDPTSCALEVVKLVLLAAAYDGVVVYANKHHCWDLLSSPKSYYIGIMDLASGIVKNCEPSILHRILNHVRNLLYNVNIRQRILARTFYVQLLWHRSVAQTLGHDFLGNIIRWIKEPDLIMKEIGLRGISNLAVHPMHTEALKSLVPLLRGFLKNEARVTVQAVKSLRNIIYHGQEEDTKVVFCSISKQLRPLINDERDQVRISATSALGHMLHRVDKFKPGSSVRREIYTFLVPLLLSIQDDNAEVVKACAGALTEWTNVIGWSSLTQTFRHTTLSDHIQVLEETCKHLVHTGKMQLVGELLSQSFGFLKSSQSFLRAAAVTFIALGSLKHDPVETVQSLVSAVLKKVDADAYSQPPCTSKLSRVSSILLKVPKKKMHLFKVVKREGDNENNQKKKIWAWVQGLPNSLHEWYNRRVESTPLVIGPGNRRLADTGAPKSKSPPEEAGLV
ncbi:PREDICTED: maestro heat-like repeat-containing protein family member 7 isoform X2 [Galeopterus variegatus]|uniref:Maestro heat-like repeat-containing protein family member 7 isoform X2 n=1 Tax=Galeopterus variegatus TaxID=482537 RepID=A0ABM0R600_GALVR|nr:PREDICTED: maestro heat-like repeat-containing protein family member 7 isoform X2 [Galeopterus variegatus]